jgi:hypothetical protein
MAQRRIAMWSGPRSLSTVMLRAWESRADTTVSDEPFYGYFLAATAAQRPGRDESLASMPQDWRSVLRQLCGPVPDGRPIWFQKHHAMHLLPEVPRTWMDELTSFFLIRDPALVALSYRLIRPEFNAEDLGLRQVREIFCDVADRTATTPVVLNAADLARAPEVTLRSLCDALDVGFSTEMLSWTPGRHDADPPLGDPWYARVQQSSGFLPRPDGVVPDLDELPATLREPVAACMPHYRFLDRYRLRPTLLPEVR